MRIELIPDISDVPLSEKPKATFIVSGARQLVRKPMAGAAAAGAGAPGHGGYAELFQNLYDAGIVTDLHGRIRDVNIRAVDSFGHTQEKFSHLNIDEIIAGVTDELLRTLYENIQEQRFTLMQAHCIRADGDAFPAEVAVSQLRLSTPHLCFFIRDETTRRRMDEMLRTEHNALQNASDAIIVADTRGEIEYANPATSRLWGFDSGTDLAGVSFQELFQDSAGAAEVLSSLSADRFAAKTELAALRADGTVFNAEIKAACNRDSDGNIIGSVVSFSDLTQREKYQFAEADAARLRETIARLIEVRGLFKSNLSGLRKIFEEATSPVQPDEAARKAHIASGADCVAALEALFADIDEELQTEA
jgi:PAS domain S-box